MCTSKVDIFQGTSKSCGPVGNFAVFCIFCYGGNEGELQIKCQHQTNYTYHITGPLNQLGKYFSKDT